MRTLAIPEHRPWTWAVVTATLAMVAALFTPAVSATPPGSALLTITVTDIHGEPLADAKVATAPAENPHIKRRRTTDPNGFVTFTELPLGERLVWLDSSQTDEIKGERSLTLLDGPNVLNYQLAESHGELTGKVVPSEFDDGSWRVCIATEGDMEDWDCTSTDDGQYDFTGPKSLPAGTYFVRAIPSNMELVGQDQAPIATADHEQHASDSTAGAETASLLQVVPSTASYVDDEHGVRSWRVTIEPAKRSTLDFDYSTDEDTTVEGNLVDYKEPLEGVIVSVQTWTGVEKTITDKNGWYSMSGKWVGPALLEIGSPWAEVSKQSFWVENGSTNSRTSDLPSYSVHGSVVDERQEPIKGAQIFACMTYGESPPDPPPASSSQQIATEDNSECISVFSDASGNYSLKPLVEGIWRIWASYQGRESRTTRWVFEPGVRADITVPLSISDVERDRLWVRVSENSAKRIEHATVLIEHSDKEDGPFTAVPEGSNVMGPTNRTNPCFTNVDGECKWEVKSGYYRVKVSAEGYTAPGTDDPILTTEAKYIGMYGVFILDLEKATAPTPSPTSPPTTPPPPTDTATPAPTETGTPTEAPTPTTPPAPAPPSVSVAVSDDVQVGQPVTITTTVTDETGTPTGTVSVVRNEGAYVVPGCRNVPLTQNGTATCTTVPSAAGDATYTATYSGDDTHEKATGNAETIFIAKGRQILTVAEPLQPAPVSGSVPLSVTSTAPDAVIDMESATPWACAVTTTEAGDNAVTGTGFGVCRVEVTSAETAHWATAEPFYVGMGVTPNWLTSPVIKGFTETTRTDTDTITSGAFSTAATGETSLSATVIAGANDDTPPAVTGLTGGDLEWNQMTQYTCDGETTSIWTATTDGPVDGLAVTAHLDGTATTTTITVTAT